MLRGVVVVVATAEHQMEMGAWVSVHRFSSYYVFRIAPTVVHTVPGRETTAPVLVRRVRVLDGTIVAARAKGLLVNYLWKKSLVPKKLLG